MYVADTYNYRIRKLAVYNYNPRYVDCQHCLLPLLIYIFSVFSSYSPTPLPSVYPSLSPSAVFYVSTVAGTGSFSYSGDNGAATSAALYGPFGVGVDVSGRQLRKHYVYSFSLHSVSILSPFLI